MSVSKAEGGQEFFLLDFQALTSFVRSTHRVAAALIVASEDIAAQSLSDLSALYELGCRAFVCGGPRAEALHDALDDSLEERGAEDVITTFHEHEDADEVVALFVELGKSHAPGAFVAVLDTSNVGVEYRTALASSRL